MAMSHGVCTGSGVTISTVGELSSSFWLPALTSSCSSAMVTRWARREAAWPIMYMPRAYWSSSERVTRPGASALTTDASGLTAPSSILPASTDSLPLPLPEIRSSPLEAIRSRPMFIHSRVLTISSWDFPSFSKRRFSRSKTSKYGVLMQRMAWPGPVCSRIVSLHSRASF